MNSVEKSKVILAAPDVKILVQRLLFFYSHSNDNQQLVRVYHYFLCQATMFFFYITNVCMYTINSYAELQIIGNLRTTVKFTTTTSVDWEKTGMRTSVSAGKRKLKTQSVGRSTTTTLNVNTNVKL